MSSFHIGSPSLSISRKEDQNMKKDPVFLCLFDKNNPHDLVVLKLNLVDDVPGDIVTDLFDNVLGGTTWLPFVVTSLKLIGNDNVIYYTENIKEFYSYIGSILSQ